MSDAVSTHASGRSLHTPLPSQTEAEEEEEEEVTVADMAHAVSVVVALAVVCCTEMDDSWRHPQWRQLLAVRSCLSRHRGSQLLDLQWVEMEGGGPPLDALREGLVRRTYPLRRIVIGACMLGDTGATTIVRALRDAELPIEDIDLYFNQITNKGLHDIVEIVRDWAGQRDNRVGVVFIPLERLNFGWNDISDEGVRELAELLRESRRPLSQLRLRSLGLANCLISNTGAEELAEEMKRNEYLSEVRLEGNDGILPNIMEQVDSMTASRTMGQSAPRYTKGFFGRRVDERAAMAVSLAHRLSATPTQG